MSCYKDFGTTVPVLNDDAFLTKVGSLGAVLSTFRFVWSWAMDAKGSSFKRVYGTLLFLQIILGFSITYTCQTKLMFTVTICLMLFTEGAHFTIIPNGVMLIFGETATSVYGCTFTFTGVTSLLMILVVGSDMGSQYTQVFHFSAVLSSIALAILVCLF